jgi:hypothetical protein
LIDISKEADACASWPTRERLRALKRIIPRARVEEVLARTGHDRSKCRRLPAWFLVWFVIGLGLFCQDCYRQVFKWLQPFRKGATPGRTTLCEARKRLGIAPLRLLSEQVIQLQGTPETPGAFYRGMRTMALDGFVVDVPDTPANARAFDRPGSSRAPAAFPQARVLALCETGSHVLWRSLIKPCSCGEVTMAHYLLRFLQEGMFLLWDRNFLSYQTLSEVRQRQAHLLARIKKNLIFEPIRVLDDGSSLSKMYRNSEDPAKALIVLYHERWEEELTIDELKTHQRGRPVLRSQTPGGVVQELYGLLLGHYVIRVLMQEAAASQGIDPRRLSFTATLKILRCRLPECPRSERGLHRWYQDLVAEVGEEVLEKRRNRINPRVIKRKMSNWKKKRPVHRNYPQPTKEFGKAIVMRR